MRLTSKYVKICILNKSHTSQVPGWLLLVVTSSMYPTYQLNYQFSRKNSKTQKNQCLHNLACWLRILVGREIPRSTSLLGRYVSGQLIEQLNLFADGSTRPTKQLAKRPSDQQACWLDRSRLHQIDSAWANDCFGRENHSVNQEVGQWLFSASRHCWIRTV